MSLCLQLSLFFIALITSSCSKNDSGSSQATNINSGNGAAVSGTNGSATNGSVTPGGGSTTVVPVVPQEPFPQLGSSASFAALSGVMITNLGSTVIYGDVGVSPGTQLSGMQLVKRTGGADHLNDEVALKAKADSIHAYQRIKLKSCDHDLTGQDLGNRVLLPGTYCFLGDAVLGGILTLDAQDNPNASFVFQVGGSLNTNENTAITLIHHGESCNVFWQVAGAVSLAGMTNFAGGILAIGDVHLGAQAKLNGKVLSRNGSILLESAEIYNNFCPWTGP